MTKKMLPSPAQMRVLEAIRDGKCWGIGGGYRVSTSTMRACRLAGWLILETDPDDSVMSRHTLTNLGRRALAASEPQP